MRTIEECLQIFHQHCLQQLPLADARACPAGSSEQTAQGIIDARALYPDSNHAYLYDEVTIPQELRRAHQKNDRAVMQAHGFAPALKESAIVAELVKIYQRLEGA